MTADRDLPPISRNLRELRLRRGLSLRALEAMTGITTSGIAMIERGERVNPTLETLQALAEALKIGLDDLTSDEPSTPEPLQRVIDSGLIGDVTLEELRQLRLARGLLGREPDQRDYYDLVELIRRRRR